MAKELSAYADSEHVLVLGIPRGGVPVAYEVAKELHVPLDIFFSRKLGVPGQEELAFGAVAVGGGRYLDAGIIAAAGISEEEVERITRATSELLEKRALLYRGDRPPIPIKGKIIILVDDGIATGASIYAAVCALRQRKPSKLVVAVPVAPASTCNWIRTSVDELVVLSTPDYFYAVGQFYQSFAQIADEEVIHLLRQTTNKNVSAGSSYDCPESASQDRLAWNSNSHEVSIAVDNMRLEGTLTIPENAKGLVLFAHGSGSSRFSPRNRYVAEALQRKGMATLLFDLLTREEESIDLQTAELRFDIPLLAERLVSVTRWITRNSDTKNFSIGYFGASTGAAAALVAAAQLPKLVSAVVSRGGRPDLAAESLAHVNAATLLLVGGLDDVVIALNRQALAQLTCEKKQLTIIPGATHLFEEPGTLEEVAQMAAEWFSDNFG